MGLAEILLGIAFPILVGTGVALAVADANYTEFWVARACFILAALDAGFFTVKWLWFSENPGAREWILGGIIAAATLICLVIGLRWVDYRDDKISTQIRPGTKQTPPMPPNCNPPDDAVVVVVGSNIAWTKGFPYTVLNMAGTKMLAIDKEAGKLRIDVLRIFDDTGSLIARG